MRGRVLAALAASALASVNAGTGLSTAATVEPSPKNLTLRLVDLPPGYYVEISSGCQPGFDPASGSPAVERLRRRHPSRICLMGFSQAWSASPDAYGPVLVSAGVVAFRDRRGAELALAAGDDVVCSLTGVCGPGLREQPSPRPIGEAVRLLGSRPGSHDDAAVVWRTGRLLGFVTIGNLPTDGGVEMALGLAERQQARMAHPTPLRRADNDDSQVMLDAPGLRLPVHWLGSSFDPPALPRRRLLQSGISRAGDGRRSGQTVSMDYGRDISLDVWRPRDWARLKRSRPARRLLCDRGCGKREPERVDGKRLTVYAAGERVIGVARVRGAVVSINLPSCAGCEQARSSPYATVRGMRAVARGLHPRQRPPRQP